MTRKFVMAEIGESAFALTPKVFASGREGFYANGKIGGELPSVLTVTCENMSFVSALSTAKSGNPNYHIAGSVVIDDHVYSLSGNVTGIHGGMDAWQVGLQLLAPKSVHQPTSAAAKAQVAAQLALQAELKDVPDSTIQALKTALDSGKLDGILTK